MMKSLLALILVTISWPLLAGDPEDPVEMYLEALEERDLSVLQEVIADRELRKMKAMVDNVILKQAQSGKYNLQQRFFGQRVTADQVRQASPGFYLEVVSDEVLKAANQLNAAIVNRTIVGQIREDTDTVHVVARLEMALEGETVSQVQLYTVEREGDEWKLTFPATFRQILTLLEASGR
jgi:hypothetical protein